MVAADLDGLLEPLFGFIAATQAPGEHRERCGGAVARANESGGSEGGEELTAVHSCTRAS
jgi:hypothetical protein